MRHLKVIDAVKFIREHNRLETWTDEAIATKIYDCIAKAALTFTHQDKKLTGICFGEWRNDNKTFHAIVMIGKLFVFVDYLKTVFPNCEEVTGFRKGKSEVTVYKIGKDL